MCLRQPPPEKLCLVRLSAIGDVTHVLPIVNTIRSHWPRTEITWIIGKSEYPLVAHLPAIDFIPFDKRLGIKAYFDLSRRLGQRRFDVLLLMQLSLRANLIPLFVKAPLRVGFDKPRSRNLHGWFVNRRIAARTRQHVLDGFFGFTEALGISEQLLVWDRCYTTQEMERVEQWLPGARKTLVIHPCASHPLRNWTVSRYAAVADHAVNHYGMRVVLTGGNSLMERRYGEEIQAAARATSMNLIGTTSLRELAALLHKADVLISPDSGPVHLATCVQTPVIGLYAGSNPERTGPYLSRSWCANHYPDAVRQILRKDHRSIRWGTRVKHKAAMRLITVEEVKEKLRRLMQSNQSSSPSRETKGGNRKLTLLV